VLLEAGYKFLLSFFMFFFRCCFCYAGQTPDEALKMISDLGFEVEQESVQKLEAKS
jgi:hypothetical protein